MIDSKAKTALEPHLELNETLVWADRPHPTALQLAGWASVAIIVPVIPALAAWDQWSSAGLVGRLVVAAVALFLIVLVSKGGIEVWSELFGTAYGLTDRRGVIVRSQPRVVCSIWPNSVQTMRISSGGAVGTLRFFPIIGFDSRDSEFRAIRNPASVQILFSQLLPEFESIQE